MADTFKEAAAHGSYLIPQGGVPAAIYFDCVISETVTRDAEVTEFPVEVGANIADHYRVKLTGVKLEVFVSQEPINDFTHPEGSPSYSPLPLDFSAHPYPTRQLDLTTIATAVVNPVGLITSAISGAINGDPRPFTAGPVLQFGQQFDSLQTLLTALDFLRSTAGLIDIATKSQYYDSFVLMNVTTNREKSTGSGTRVSIEFKKIATVQTQQTTVALPQKPKDKPPVNKGAQQPQDPGTMQSAASAIVGAIGSAVGF